MIATIRKCLHLLDPGVRGRWIALVLLGVLASMFEALGAILIIVVLGLMQGPKAALDLPVVGDLRAHFPGTSASSLFSWVCVVTGAFFIVRSVILLVQAYAQNRIAQNAGVRLAATLFEGYLQAPYEDHARRNSSVLIRNISESIHSLVSWTLLPLLGIASEGLLILGVIVVLALAAPGATLAGAVFLGVQVAVLMRILRPRLARLGTTAQDMAAESLQSLQQSLQGFREVRLSGRVGSFVGEYNERRSSLARAQYLQATLVTLPRLLVETVFVLGLLGFLLVSTHGNGASSKTLSLVGLFAYAVLRVMPSLNRIVMNVGNLRFGGAAVDELTGELERLRAAQVVSPLPGAVVAGPWPLVERMEARRVRYRYPETDVDAVQDATLVIERGQFIGLVGATGSGKSTLVDLLIGLLRPTEGEISVDGRRIDADLPGWQRSLGVVSQTVFLVDDTLRRNIAFGVPEAQIDDARVVEAVHMAQLEELVGSLTEGLETLVGERGVRLSGGQRQRVAIARALYERPSVLFFDEGTSALDTLTEAEVMASLGALRGECTVVAVAHRLTTVRECDRIYVIDGGRVVDEGTYDDLVERSAAFRRMAT